jgi:hypothetical protein
MPCRLRNRSLAILFLALFVARCSTGAGRSMGPGNNPPVANADQATTPQGTPATVTVTANDTDPDGHGVSLTGATLETPATGVSVTTNLENGTVTVDPGPSFTGTIEVSYEIIDDGSPPRTATGMLTVGVVAGNPPVTVDDQATTQQGVPVTVDVLANDSDPDGGSLTTVDPTFLGTQPAGSSVQVNGDGTLTIDPGPSFTGTFEVGYIARDPTGLEGAGKVTVTVVAPSPATSVRVDVVNDSGDPLAGVVAAIRLANGAWMPATETSPGRFDIDVPEGESRWGITARVGDVAQTIEATTAEAASARLTFRDMSAPLVNFGFSWNGADNLGTGVLGVLLNGLQGFVASGGGASGGGTVPQYPADPQDFGLVVTDDGVPVGARFVRDVTPTEGGTLDFSFTADDQGGSMAVDPFSVPAGFSGDFLISFTTGAANVPVGSGTSAGGVFYTLPSGQMDPATDYYVARGGAAMAGAGVSHTMVGQSFNAMTFDLPGAVVYPAPAPASYPTFTDLSSDDPDHQMFELNIGRSAPGPQLQWRLAVTQGWLDLAPSPAPPFASARALATSYTVPDPTGLPGFADFAFNSGDSMFWVVERVSSNTSLSEILSAPTALGVPLVDGLSQRFAGVNGAFTVP